MAALFGLPGETITSRIGVLPDHLPMPALPETSLARLQELLLSALIIAFLPGAGSLLPAMVADLMLEGVLRAGNLIRFIPEAVFNGFTIGIAIIIATSQMKDLFGLEIANLPADFLHKLPVLWAGRETLNLAALDIGLVTLALIVLLRRLAPK